MTHKPDMTLDQRLNQLFQRRQFTIKLGLDRIVALAAALDDPQRNYAVVHVAGTNGKGSTCACLEAVLRAAGLRTGLYTSPHLVRFSERIRINGACVADDELTAAMDRVDAACRQATLTGDEAPTFFEYTTALAFDCFRAGNVQVAVVETGLGGRLDATNIVTPIVTIITPIGMDHAEHLGHTLDAVAAEKAGIIKPDRPVVIAPQDERAIFVLTEVATRHHAPVYQVDELTSIQSQPLTATAQKIHYESTLGLSGTFSLSLGGGHQAVNAATALLGAELFTDAAGIPLDPATVRLALQSLRWPGRFSQLEDDPPLYADAAHNPDGARALTRLLKRHIQRPIAMIVGMCDDKDVETTIHLLTSRAERLWAISICNARSADPARILAAAHDTNTTICNTLEEALHEARIWAREENGCICVTGSIFQIGALYALLGRDPFDA